MNELATIPQSNQIIRTFDDAARAADLMYKSGLFSDIKQAGQALVKILAGQELGFGPYASMTGVSIIQGKTSIGANLMAAAIKRTNKYNYKIIKLDDQTCELAFYENREEAGRSVFTIDDAKKAGLLSKDNWSKYPRNMLFARALSNGQRWYCPDIFNGQLVYTPDELGATVDEDGNAIIEAQVKSVQEHQSEPPHITEPLPVTDQTNTAIFDIPVELTQYAGICTEDGTPYPLLSLKELTTRYNSLTATLKANGLSDKDKSEKTRKHDAAKAIIEYKRSHPGA